MEGQTDRQADREKGRWVDGQTDGWGCRWMYGRVDRWVDGQTDKCKVNLFFKKKWEHALVFVASLTTNISNESKYLTFMLYHK